MATRPGSVAAPQRNFPEIVISVCAAVGTDTTAVCDALASALRSVGYTPVPIRLSALMAELPGLAHLPGLQEEDRRIRESQKAGNEIRRTLNNGDAVVRLALPAIQAKRTSLNASQDPTVPAERHCFIISSLKREEELDTLQALFGEKVLLVSVYEPQEQRLANLCSKIATSKKSSDPDAHRQTAEQLIDVDQKERSDPFGQRVGDVFPKADVFLTVGASLRDDARRFVQLLFGAPFIIPTVDEMMMFQARAAAQRSADLSRRVGAVIATPTVRNPGYRLQPGPTGRRWRQLGQRHQRPRLSRFPTWPRRGRSGQEGNCHGTAPGAIQCQLAVRGKDGDGSGSFVARGLVRH